MRKSYEEAMANLDKAGWCVNRILAHCAPNGIARKIDPHYQPDRLTAFLESVRQRCQFSQWFFGHYHDNRVIGGRYVLQWEQISRLELQDME